VVEPQLIELMDHPDVTPRDLSSLHAVMHIGASAPAALRLRARQRLGPVIAHTYGASEMGIVSGLAPAEHDPSHPQLFTSAGRIHSGVEVRFRRPDGTFAGPAEPGSIKVRSPAMACGYRNRPVEQAAAFQAGWYRSGDLGLLDAEGYLQILGRACDVSVADEAMVTPTAVENTLCRLATVCYAVIVVDREVRSWIAAVVGWPGATADPAACRAAVAVEHGDAAAESMVVVPVDAIPLTEQGKPDRAAILRLGPLSR